MQDTKCQMMWQKNLPENLFSVMLFSVSFRLFCNAVSKEGCDRKESVKWQSKIIFFKQPG